VAFTKNKMIFLTDFIKDKTFFRFLNKSFLALIVKILGVIISFFVSIIISRSLGADGLGVINLASKILSILMLLSLFGVNQIIVREIAKELKLKNYERVNSIVSTSIRMSLFLSLLLSFVLFCSANWLSSNIFHNKNLEFVFEIFAISMPFQVIARIYASSAIGMNKIWQGSLVNQTLTMFIIASVLLYFIYFEKIITIQVIVYSYLFARAIQLLFFKLYWSKSLKPESSILTTDYKGLWNMSHPLLIASASVVLSESLATIFLGIYSNTFDVGLFSVASRLAIFTSFILQVTNSALSPKISEMYHSKNFDSLQNLIYKITKLVAFFGLCIFLIYFFLGENILKIWGDEFIDAYIILIILSFGQLFNLATGSSGVILIMTGLQKIRRNISIVSLLLNLILCPILIFYWSAVGAAIAIASVLIIENIIKLYYVYIKTKLKLFKI